MIKYKVEGWRYRGRIEPVEVISESEFFITRMQGKRKVREAKHSDYGAYFDTWEQARGFLVSVIKVRIDKASNDLKCAQNELVELESLQPPAQEDAA